MSVNTRGHVWRTAASSSESFTRCAQESGDTVMVFMVGGNRTTSNSDWWRNVDYKAGQEAQGSVMVDNAEWGEDSETLSVGWDGSDPHAVLMVAVEKGCEFDFDSERVGAVGASYPSADVSLDLPARSGDVQVVVAFARNSTTIPTSDLGAPTYSTVIGGSAAAAWIVNPGTRSTTTVTVPAGRSGHYVAGANFWKNPALEDASADLPGDVWAVLERPGTAMAGGSSTNDDYFDSVTYVDGTPGADPVAAGYTRLMGELVIDNPDLSVPTSMRWIVDALHTDVNGPSMPDGYAAYSNDQGYGQTFYGPQARRQVYAPYFNSYNDATGGYDWPLLELFNDVGTGNTRSNISFRETGDWNSLPLTYGFAPTRFRLYIYKPRRRTTPPLRHLTRRDGLTSTAGRVTGGRSQQGSLRRVNRHY